jgi:hypothetical protein
MRARNRSRLGNAAIGTILLCVIIWMTPIDADWIPPARLTLAGLAFVLGSWWFLTTPTAAQRATNVWRERFGMCYECSGMIFVPRFEVRDGVLWLDVYYQNRFTQPCRAGVFVIPMEGWSPDKPGGGGVPAICADIDCAGGEVGVIHHPSAVGHDWQGRLMIYDIYAAAEYPQGRGEQLLSEEGTRVGAPPNEALTALRVAGALLHGGWGGLVASTAPRAGKIELQLPQGVAETLADGVVPTKEVVQKGPQ